MRILDNVDDMRSSNIMCVNSRATYVRYIRVGKTMMNSQIELSVLEKLF